MSEQQQQQAPKRKLSLYALNTVLHFWLQLIRARNDPKVFGQVVENFAQESGAPPQDIPIVHNAFIAIRDAGKTNRPTL